MNKYETLTEESDHEDTNDRNDRLISLSFKNIKIFCSVFDWFLTATLIANCIKYLDFFTWFKMYSLILILVFVFFLYRGETINKSISNLLTFNENVKLVLFLSNLLLFSSYCCKNIYSLVIQHNNLSNNLNSGTNFDYFPFINLGLNTLSLVIMSYFSFTLFSKNKTDIQRINLNTMYKHFAALLILMGVFLSFYLYWFNNATLVKELAIGTTLFIILFCVLPILQPKKYSKFRDEKKFLIVASMIRICCFLIRYSGFIDHFSQVKNINYQTN
ncbi:hypothetical protein TUBRATIS_23430 [Tubulinosema ratisbonensis]|uniref:Uncharacterized protein n=1 Tax=Tubulinosema ratisbonensis TaxID=291195 RepID=A0A437AJC4_9MICR|nr:hypothetical protein TUBRATIS_23430 [Tubulinosema ratisbonensis]